MHCKHLTTAVACVTVESFLPTLHSQNIESYYKLEEQLGKCVTCLNIHTSPVAILPAARLVHASLEFTVCRGNFGVVFRATSRRTGELVAVKRIDIRKTAQTLVDIEIRVMDEVKGHPHTISLLEVFSSPQYFYLVLEYMAGGELFDRLIHMGAYGEEEAKEAVRAMASALKLLHAQGWAHRDLKPENLLLTSPDSGSIIKVADFGLAGRLVPGQLMTRQCGTWAYAAPEMRAFHSPGYDESVDTW